MSRSAIAGSCTLSLALGLLAACSAANTEESSGSSSDAVTVTHPVYDDYQPPPPRSPPVFVNKTPAPTYPLPGCALPFGADTCTVTCDANFANCTFGATGMVLTDPTGAALPCTVYGFTSQYVGTTTGTSLTSGASDRSFYVADCSDTPAVRAWPDQTIPVGLLSSDDTMVTVNWPYWYPNNPADPSAPQVTGNIGWVPVEVPYEANVSTSQVPLVGANVDANGTPHIYLRFRENSVPIDKCTLNGQFCVPPAQPIDVFGGCVGASCQSVAPPPVEPSPIAGKPFP